MYEVGDIFFERPLLRDSPLLSVHVAKFEFKIKIYIFILDQVVRYNK